MARDAFERAIENRRRGVFDDEGGFSPLRPSGEATGRADFSRGARFLDNLVQTNDLRFQGIGPLIGQFPEQLGNIMGVAGDTFSQVVSHDAGFDEQDFKKEKRGEPDPDNAISQGIKGIGRWLWTGSTEEQGGEGGIRGPDDLSPITDEQRQQAAMDAQEQAAEIAERGTFYEEILNMSDLLPQERLMVEELRAQDAEKLDELELQLMELQEDMQVQDVIFEQQLDLAGLGDIEISSLERAMELEGGIGSQTLTEIGKIAENAALSAAEKNEAIDLLMTRESFSREITRGIEDVVRNKTDVEELMAMPDAERLFGAAKFFEPTFENAQIVDPTERFMTNFDDVVFSSEIGDIVAGMDDLQFSVYEGATQLLASKGPDSPEYQAAVQRLAQATGVEYSQWNEVLTQAQRRAEASEAAFEAATAEDVQKLKPGDEPMVYALIGAGREMGIPDDVLTLMANSPFVHALIDQKSGGRAGATGDGTIRGVGGLTEEMYQTLMGEEWSPDKGMQWELQALLAYLVRGFNGDPVAAWEYYRSTQSWGGAPSKEAAPANG